MDLKTVVIVGAVPFLAFVCLFGRRSRYVFRIAIDGGKARVVAGQTSSSFVRGCSEIARFSPIVRGEILGLSDGDEVRLRFSQSISEDIRQQFRNLWGIEQSTTRPTISRLKKKPGDQE